MPIGDDQFNEYLKNPIAFPPAFKDWVSDYFATNVPKLHVSQIFGFKLQSIKVADDVPGNEVVSTTAYGDLTTPGPSLTNLANGFYVVMWGCYCNVSSSTSNNNYMSVSVDGAAPAGELEMLLSGTELAFSVGRLALVDLSAGDNTHTLAAKYKYTQTWPGTIGNRWLHALKVVTS